MNNIIKHYGIMVAVAVMAAIAIIFFYPDNVEGNVLQQHDMQQGIANGQEITAYAEANGVDTPRWTNSLFGGMPTFQISPSYPSNGLFDWLNGVYGLWLPSPSNILMMMFMGMFILLSVMGLRWYYALIGAVAWGFSSYFIIIIGAGHIWKFLTLSYVPPTVAGLILAYRGRSLWGAGVTALFAMMQISSNHVQMTYYFGLLMAIIVCCYAVSLIRRGQWRRWLRATLVVLGAGALAVAANLPSLYNTYQYSKETIRGGSELAAADGTAAGGLDMEYLTQYSYGKVETLTLLIPNAKGGASARPVAGQMQMMPVADLDADGTLASDLGLNEYERMYAQSYVTQYFGEPESTNGPVYVGAIIFALFILGCCVVRGPLKWALLTGTILSVGLAWGRNFMSLTELFVNIVPMYSQFRTPESILVIAEFAMPVLGILGLQQVLTAGEDQRRRYLTPVLVSFGACAFVCLLGWVAPRLFGNPITQADIALSGQIRDAYAAQGADPRLLSMFSINNPRVAGYVSELRLGMVSADSGRSLLLLLLAGTLVALPLLRRSCQGRTCRLLAAAGVGLLVLVDLYGVDKRYISTESFTAAPVAAPIAATEADMYIMQDRDPDYRVLDIPRFADAAPSYYHKTVGGYHAAKLSRYQDLIERQISNNNMAVLNMLNTRYIVYGPSASDVQYNPGALGNAWFVGRLRYVDGAAAEMSALDTLDPASEAVADRRFAATLGTAVPPAAGDTVRLTSYAPDRLTYSYDSRRGGVAVFSEIYFPWGWQVKVNGKPAALARVNYVLRALRLPAGHGTVEMTFDPGSLHTTGSIATVAVILIYLTVAAAILLPLYRRFRAKTKTE